MHTGCHQLLSQTVARVLFIEGQKASQVSQRVHKRPVFVSLTRIHPRKWLSEAVRLHDLEFGPDTFALRMTPFLKAQSWDDVVAQLEVT